MVLDFVFHSLDCHYVAHFPTLGRDTCRPSVDYCHDCLAGWPQPSQVAERNWQRRKKAVLFLVGSKFRPMQRDAAAAKHAQEVVDNHAKLPGIPRRSKEENLAYLHKEVSGHEGIQRCLVGML